MLIADALSVFNLQAASHDTAKNSAGAGFPKKTQIKNRFILAIIAMVSHVSPCRLAVDILWHSVCIAIGRKIIFQALGAPYTNSSIAGHE